MWFGSGRGNTSGCIEILPPIGHQHSPTFFVNGLVLVTLYCRYHFGTCLSVISRPTPRNVRNELDIYFETQGFHHGCILMESASI